MKKWGEYSLAINHSKANRNINRQKRTKRQLNALRSLLVVEQTIFRLLHTTPIPILMALVCICGIFSVVVGLISQSIEPTTDMITFMCMIVVVFFNALKLLLYFAMNFTGKRIEKLASKAHDMVFGSNKKED